MKNLPIWLLFIIMAACQKPVGSHTDQWRDYRKGYQFFNKNNDSAFFYFNKAATASTDKQVISRSYRVMAAIQSDAGDNYGAQESLALSLKELEGGILLDHDDLATDYDELGLTFLNLGDPEHAIPYFHSALQYVRDNKIRSYFLNHLGNAYSDKKNFTEALRSYHNALQLAGKDEVARSRILTNIAVAKLLQDSAYNAGPALLSALGARIRVKDSWGQNSSYQHLADFYTYKRPDSAVFYARNMLGLSVKLRSADQQLVALQQLITLSEGIQAKHYFQRYLKLNDSVQKARNNAKNQFALIRYNVEKGKAENLLLQRQNSEKRYQLFGLLAFTGCLAAFSIWWYRKRQQRLRLQAERDIQESKLELSQKVHDKVANGIYRVMSELEHNPALTQGALLDQLEYIYETSRNIAHDQQEAAIDFSERIGIMLNAFKRRSLKLGITGNDPALWQHLDGNSQEQLLLVLQELMVNMSKHSAASQAYVSFSVTGGELLVNYRDNGIGLTKKQSNGMGYQNTVSRIKTLNGSVTFGSEESNGLYIAIRLPTIL